jgi:hypothetical protein
MKILLALLLTISLWAGQTKHQYEKDVVADMLKLQRTASYFLSEKDYKGLIDTNRVILTRMITSPDVHTMDVYVLLYLEYKRKLLTMMAMHYQANLKQQAKE